VRSPVSNFIIPLSDPAAARAEEVGGKAANLARLAGAGLPTPGGFVLTATAYRHQLRHLGVDVDVRAHEAADFSARLRLSVQVRLALYQGAIAPAILEPLIGAWRAQRAAAPLGAVRSSALVEDSAGASFAGQFESFLGLNDESEFLTATRACWAALWTSRARRYMEPHGLSPAKTAMAVLIQPLIQAQAAGGGLSETAEGEMSISATWGLGSALAQGEVVPDRIVLDRNGRVLSIDAGRKPQRDQCVHGLGLGPRAVPARLACEASIGVEQAEALGAMLLKAESICGGPVEIEWALDEHGPKLLQGRPLRVEPAPAPDQIWLQHPGLRGHPAGIGWGAGRSVVVRCECELARVGLGDILVTQVAGPALTQVLARVGGVVTELGGSTSHLASLARERGIPMVLGVLGATHQIPDGSQVAVDGVAGIVRWVS
jgi:pyruvate, water dikinase